MGGTEEAETGQGGAQGRERPGTRENGDGRDRDGAGEETEDRERPERGRPEKETGDRERPGTVRGTERKRRGGGRGWRGSGPGKGSALCPVPASLSRRPPPAGDRGAAAPPALQGPQDPSERRRAAAAGRDAEGLRARSGSAGSAAGTGRGPGESGDRARGEGATAAAPGFLEAPDARMISPSRDHLAYPQSHSRKDTVNFFSPCYFGLFPFAKCDKAQASSAVRSCL